mgnify:CR=1 FL=1
MRNDELIALAERKGINLDGCKKHDEYVERIQGALGLVDFSATELGLGGTYEQTMGEPGRGTGLYGF